MSEAAKDRTNPVWTKKRVIVTTLLGLHTACVVASALPNGGLRDGLLAVRAPLPALNTHRGEFGIDFASRGIAQSWLELSAQYQRWTMFTPRRPNLFSLSFEHRAPTGTTNTFELRERTDYGVLRGCRWGYLESALVNPNRRRDWLPAALPALARQLIADPRGRLTVAKLIYPLPLLADDGTGNPLFTTAADWLAMATDTKPWVRVELGMLDLDEARTR